MLEGVSCSWRAVALCVAHWCLSIASIENRYLLLKPGFSECSEFTFTKHLLMSCLNFFLEIEAFSFNIPMDLT